MLLHIAIALQPVNLIHDKKFVPVHVHVTYFRGLSGSEDRGGDDNSIQFINLGRVGDKSFKEWRQKIWGWKAG